MFYPLFYCSEVDKVGHGKWDIKNEKYLYKYTDIHVLNIGGRNKKMWETWKSSVHITLYGENISFI